MIIFNSFDNGKKLRTHLHTRHDYLGIIKPWNRQWEIVLLQLKVQNICGYTVAYVLIFWHFCGQISSANYVIGKLIEIMFTKYHKSNVQIFFVIF